MQILPTDWPRDDSQGIQHLAESHSHKYNANDKKMQIIKKTCRGPCRYHPRDIFRGWGGDAEELPPEK